MSDRAIAEQLRVSVRTIETHLTRAYAKLGLQGRIDLTSVFAGALTG
jgi:DNA-binding NarL/FixJ family response regulator